MALTRYLCAAAAVVLCGLSLGAHRSPVSTDAPEYGPPSGTLLIAGGGNLAGTGIEEKFIELAGGIEARIVIVPTAGGNRDREGKLATYTEEEIVRPWARRGLKNVSMLHTHDPKVADTVAFVAALREANGVWFNGGRQWNIVDSYAGTLTYAEFHKVLERGGVIGGSSAGATIQGEYLVRGDTSGPDVMMTSEPDHQEAFRFLRRTAIDQHINARNRWDDLIPVIQKFPTLLGIGLSEGTAIVVKGDTFEVIGKWKVAIHDNTRPYQPWEKPYFVLSPGDVYNMKTRRVEKYGNGTPPRRSGSGGEGPAEGNGPAEASPYRSDDRAGPAEADPYMSGDRNVSVEAGFSRPVPGPEGLAYGRWTTSFAARSRSKGLQARTWRACRM